MHKPNDAPDRLIVSVRSIDLPVILLTACSARSRHGLNPPNFMNPVELRVVTRLSEDVTPSVPSPQASFPFPIQSEASMPWFRFDTHPRRHAPHDRDSPPPSPIRRPMRQPCATLPRTHPVPCRVCSSIALGILPRRSPSHRPPHQPRHAARPAPDLSNTGQVGMIAAQPETAWSRPCSQCRGPGLPPAGRRGQRSGFPLLPAVP